MKRKKPAARATRQCLRECAVGDIVLSGDDHLKVFGELAGHGLVRRVDETTLKEIGESRFLSLDLEVEVVLPAAVRFAASAAGGEADPLKRGGQS